MALDSHHWPSILQRACEKKKWAWTLESALHHYWTCSVEQVYHKYWTWTLNYAFWQYWYHVLEQVVTNAELALWSTCLAANEQALYGFCVPQLLSCLSPGIMVLLRPMCPWDIEQVCPNYWVVLWSMVPNPNKPMLVWQCHNYSWHTEALVNPYWAHIL